MTVTYQVGNLLTTNMNVIAHGVNCMGVMGAGVALAIRNKWPIVYDQYMGKYRTVGWKLGDCQTISVGNHQIVANLATQYGEGVNYDAIRKSLTNLRKAVKWDSIAIPKIGAGIGGGDWNVISDILDSLTFFDYTVYVLNEKEIPSDHH